MNENEIIIISRNEKEVVEIRDMCYQKGIRKGKNHATVGKKHLTSTCRKRC